MSFMRSITTTTLSLMLLGISWLGQAQSPRAKEMPAPKPIGAVPTEAQMSWHQLETYAFIHFGLNTYNDLEWGYGNTPASTFNPKVLDTDQWVRTLKAAGMRAVILTAKHHDGFCLWPTKTTDYSVKNSPWKGGKGDLVKDLVASCRKYGLKFGLYLSPWDRHHAEYGREGYQRAFHEQIRELTTQYGELFEYWFDGANGGTGWYGGADERRNINPNQYYKYEEAAELLRQNNPDIMIFGGTVPTIRWIGNEAGWAGETNYATYDREAEKHHRENIWGHRGAKEWLPGEVDVSIRPGWFYHPREDHQVRSVANLTNIYYQSVGRGANLLLNFPVNLEGKIPQADSINAVTWHRHIRESFRHNLAKGARVEARDTRRGRTFSPRHIVDGKPDSYWATIDGVSTAEVTLRLPRRRTINNVVLQEYIRLGQRIESFSLETQSSDGSWHPIDTRDSLTTVGYKRIVRFRPVETSAIRLRINKSMGPVCLAELGVYHVRELVDAPLVSRDEHNRLILRPAASGGSTDYRLRYRLNDGPWQDYTGPVIVPSDHLRVEAAALSSGGQSSKVYELGYSQGSFSLGSSLSEEERRLLVDGDGYTSVHFDKSVRQFDFYFPSPRPITRLVYTPNQGRDASGHIQRYRLFVDDVLATQGEFQNIKANPIPSEIKLDKPVEGRHIRLVVDGVLDNQASVSIGDFAIY